MHVGDHTSSGGGHPMWMSQSWSVAAGCVVLLMGVVCPQIVDAATTPPVLLVKIDNGCANAATQAQFVKELKVRLPEKTEYLSQADATKAYWTLYWNVAPDQGCRVMLSDVKSVMALPLVANAEPSQIRDVLVRLVWVMSTTSPKPTQKKKEPPKETKPADVAPKVPKPTDSKSSESKPDGVDPKKPDPSKDVPLKDPDPPGDAIKRPGPTKRETKKTSAGQELIGDVADVLNSFRASAPELFGDVRATTNAMRTSLFGVRTTVGLHAAASTKVTFLQDKPAWIGGLHVGMFIGQHFSLGVSYHSLLNELKYQDDADVRTVPGEEPGATEDVSARRELNLNVAALDLEYVLFPEHQLHLSLSGSFGVGMASWEARYRNDELEDRGDNHLLVMVDVNAILFYDVTDWMQLGFGFGWRDLSGFNFREIGPGDMSGPSGSLTLRIGLF